MILYKAIADCKKCEDENIVTMKSECMAGFKTAYSSFHVWKSDGYTILEAYIELYDNGEKIDTIKVDISKLM